MSIARMKLVNIEGNIRQLDAAVLKCSYGNNFHPEQASMYYESMGAVATYNEENPYTSLLRRITEIGLHAGIDLSAENARGYYTFNLNYIENLPAKLKNIKRYSSEVRELLEELEGKPLEKGDIYNSESIRFRFGRLPMKNYKHLKKQRSRNFIFYPLQTDKGYEWGVYVTSLSTIAAVDKFFAIHNFERIGVPRDIFFNPDNIQNYNKEILEIDRDALESYLEHFDTELLELNSRQNTLSERIARYEQTLIQLNHIENLDIAFDEIFTCKYIKVRFGRLPVDSFSKLKYYEDKPFVFYTFVQDSEYCWGVYFVPASYSVEIDAIFNSLFYERFYVPDTVHDTPEASRAQITKLLHECKEELAEVLSEIKAKINRRKLYFYESFARIKFLSDSFEMRRYISVINDTFHIIGFVPENDAQAFKSGLESLEDVKVTVKPCETDVRFTPPTKLKNGIFFKPFEMFVDMYGMPSYHDLDPTVFVGITYTLLFGLMFGDVGQGLCIVLIGSILWRTKRMPLGRVMKRIGISSTCFGFLYGSVFGYEHLLDPFYINVLGLKEKPIETLAPEMTNFILLGAVGVGVLIIIAAMITNTVMGIRQKDPSRALLSQNGFAGLVLYCTALVGAVLLLVYKVNIFNPVVILLFIILPIILIFLREPIAKLLKRWQLGGDNKKGKIIDESGTVYKAPKNENLNTPIGQILNCRYLQARFGRLPRDSYNKLRYYDDKLFIFYITETDKDYYWGVYFAPGESVREIDSIFSSLYFEQLRLPATLEGLSDETLSDIAKLMSAEAANGEAKGKKEHEGPIGYFIENFFELFDIILSYVTNTMSFLRVGGFILSHAGMMAVVMTLTEVAGAGASPIILVVGNAFVMVMEGLIVGIQVLRLEFYEMFSRYFQGDGKPFTPITVGSMRHNSD